MQDQPWKKQLLIYSIKRKIFARNFGSWESGNMYLKEGKMRNTWKAVCPSSVASLRWQKWESPLYADDAESSLPVSFWGIKYLAAPSATSSSQSINRSNLNQAKCGTFSLKQNHWHQSSPSLPIFSLLLLFSKPVNCRPSRTNQGHVFPLCENMLQSIQ